MNPRKIFLHNWEAKLVCLILAAAIWYVLRYYVVPTGSGEFRPLRDAAEKRAQP
jgi:hypothetical protein